jgi:hypothetical protein
MCNSTTERREVLARKAHRYFQSREKKEGK